MRKSKLFHHKKTKLILILPTVLLLAALIAAIGQIRTLINSRASNGISLVPPTTISARVGEQFTYSLSVTNQQARALRSVDLAIRFPQNALRLVSIQPNTNSNMKAFMPFLPTGAFDSVNVINSANSTGLISMSAATFDLTANSLTAAQTSSTVLVNLVFQPLTAGSHTISFDTTKTVAAVAGATQSNLLAQSDMPSTVVNATQVVATNSPAPTVTASPTVAPTQTPVATRTPVPTATVAPTIAPTVTPAPTQIPGSALFDGSFETGGLTNFVKSGATVSSTAFYAGTNGVILANNNAYVGRQINTLLKAGVSYEITAYVRVVREGRSWGSPRLTCSFFQDLGSSNCGLANAKDLRSSGWQKLTITKTFTASEISRNIFIGVKNFGFPGTSHVDNLIIVPK
jgi:hypothetical protein